ncbi:hypothetical protein LJC60_10310, partial [Ruminococcaceae bacterium OttesenSCG-928-D13]|nr:hypothetical protein [Ruminococcaceae bacterium OttesenSCG-928-D13]
PGTPLHTRLSRIVNERLVLDALKTTVVDVELWTADTGDEFDAWQEEAFIEAVSYGGDTTGVQIPFNLHLTGKRVKGKFDIAEKSFIAAP